MSLALYRAWADIAGALHSRNRYWIVADIIEALVPCGSVAVDAQTIIWTHLGAAKVSSFALYATSAALQP